MTLKKWALRENPSAARDTKEEQLLALKA